MKNSKENPSGEMSGAARQGEDRAKFCLTQKHSKWHGTHTLNFRRIIFSNLAKCEAQCATVETLDEAKH
ncbi:hypothetical protein HAX54_035628, partial [Datura stramonium]|nr:hypothetical protein [Datura stramonium]